MTDYCAIANEAEAFGFSHSGALDTIGLAFLPEVRAMCEANGCGVYGKTWMCPPAVGSLELWSDRVREFEHGIVVQTTAQLEDSFDIENMQLAEKTHKRLYDAFRDVLDRRFERVLPLDAGSCGLCRVCAYPEPCRFPNRAHPSLEACGLVVTDVCRLAGLKYYYGQNTLTYSGMFLF